MRRARVAAVVAVVAATLISTEGARPATAPLGGSDPVTARVSVGPGGAEASGGGPATSTSPAVSGDGRRIAFVSDATNLTVGDTNGVTDVFRHDRATGATGRVSLGVDPAAADPDGASSSPAVSAEGSVIAFESEATNLITSDTNQVADIFVADPDASPPITRVDVGDAVPAGGDSSAPSLSADGRLVGFASDATDLAPGGVAGPARRFDVYLHERALGRTTRVAIPASGAGTGASAEPAIAMDGRAVAFASDSPGFVPGDSNGASDVFVRDRRPAAFRSDCLVAGDGGIFAFGDAGFAGSAGNLRLKAPIAGMTPA